MHKELKIFLLLSAIFALNSCDENTTANGETAVQLFQPQNSNIFYGDTLVLFGLSLSKDETKILALQDKDTLVLGDGLTFVNNSEFRFVNKLLSGKYDIVAQSGVETSEKIEIDFYSYPFLNVVEVPSGVFQIGSESGIFDERPTKEITITKSFEISKYEISQFLWKAVDGGKTYFKSSRTRPVDGISWRNAIDFCNQLSEIWGLDPAYTISESNIDFNQNANGWRLPTEAEWEYSAKAGSNSDYFGFESPFASAWYSDNSGYNIQPSGLLNPNPFGIYDLLGNLEEWVWDYYSEDSYQQIDEIDPTGVSNGEFRVSRGGHYKSGLAKVRTSSRNADNDLSTKGLRIVRTLD